MDISNTHEWQKQVYQETQKLFLSDNSFRWHLELFCQVLKQIQYLFILIKSAIWENGVLHIYSSLQYASWYDLHCPSYKSYRVLGKFIPIFPFFCHYLKVLFFNVFYNCLFCLVWVYLFCNQLHLITIALIMFFSWF